MIGLLTQSLHVLGMIALASFAPTVAWRRADRAWQRSLVVAIHVTAMGIVLGLLSAAQVVFRLDAFVRSSLPLLRALWLPILGVLIYATAWSAWFFARTLRRPDERPLFDSATATVRTGLDRFTRAGIDVSRTPLYLILGSPAGGIREFFAAAHVELAVLPQPEESDEAVQVCGNREAIYVCCRDVSLLGTFTREAARARVERRQVELAGRTRISRSPAHLWADRAGASGASGASATATAATGSASSQTRSPAGSVAAGTPAGSNAGGTAVAIAPGTNSAGGLSPTVDQAAADQATLERLNRTFTDLETLTDERSSESATVLQPKKPSSPLLRLDPVEAEQCLERLDAVCRELAERRRPYCPINGVLVMVPLDAADDTELADHVGMRVERDLQTVAAATETSVSAQWIFCDLDQCQGSHAFLDRFPETQRHRRLGTCLPAPPPSEPDAEAEGIDRAVRWICDELFPPLGYRLMRRDVAAPSDDRLMSQENRRIHRLVDVMRGRRAGMSRMLRRAVATAEGRVRLRGCFIAATGVSAASGQAFAEGCIPFVLDLQNEVQWSRDRRRRDRWQRRAAIAIYFAVAAATVLTVVWSLSSF